MKNLTEKEITQVSGGVTGFIYGYLGGKVIDASLECFSEYVDDFSSSSHSWTANYEVPFGAGFGTI
ncbi:hypothetical protein [Aestuariibacter salexigens]|uniref:hypothetical protein n=1 Tax=Aestuariibacter salexigens TaxID=226010 RepID=UPI0004222873|nr:hypothetical protein [Aestuariibacter salexigens]